MGDKKHKVEQTIGSCHITIEGIFSDDKLKELENLLTELNKL